MFDDEEGGVERGLELHDRHSSLNQLRVVPETNIKLGNSEPPCSWKDNEEGGFIENQSGYQQIWVREQMKAFNSDLDCRC